MANNVVANYQVQLHGPIFTGAIYGQMKACIRDIEDDIGDELVETIQGVDDATFVHPTGHARSKVRKHRSGGTMTVDRSSLAYGPWLEDGGSRAHLFSGYHAFEKAAREVDRKVPEIVDRAVDRHVIRR